MKAIETIYNGYKFRSRLEARYAVFFDALGVKYEYEKEGYDLDGARYLPDFWLSQQKCWIEIKGQPPTSEEKKKANLLSRHCLQSVHIFYGEIEMPRIEQRRRSNVFTYHVSEYSAGDISFYEHDGGFGWTQCPWCLRLDITWGRAIYHMPCGCYRYIEPFLARNKPLADLIQHCPDMKVKEPRSTYAADDTAYSLAIMGWWDDKIDTFLYGGDTPRLIAAYTAARQARFEHGETPKTR